MANPTTIIKSAGGVLVDLVPSAAATASSTGPTLVGCEAYSAATVFLNVTAATGTTPTLDVKLQKLLPDSTAWMDIAAFGQMTTTGKRVLDFLPSNSSQLNTPVDGTLAASTTLTTLLGGTIRIKYVIGGTNPSFTFQVSAELLKR